MASQNPVFTGPITHHVYMQLSWPKTAEGNTDYCNPRQWQVYVEGGYKMDNTDERIFLYSMPITPDVPPTWDPVPQQVDALRSAKAQVYVRAEETIKQLDEKLEKLLAITHDA